ncbi:hypothetical protein PG996_007599 [Apiospora saccharicola]|uniref:Uncharacterized protein n=1 Tax=Apiospora saccharicola TaxID=335842 RepID=A0ABR1VBA0_9PEZI
MMLPEYADLAPQILRQRLVIEGYPAKAITETDKGLPVQAIGGHADDSPARASHPPERPLRPLLFFGIDIYNCKQFDPKLVVGFTRDFFKADHITAKDFNSSPIPVKPVIDETILTAAAGVARYTLSDTDIERLSWRLLAEGHLLVAMLFRAGQAWAYFGGMRHCVFLVGIDHRFMFDSAVWSWGSSPVPPGERVREYDKAKL